MPIPMTFGLFIYIWRYRIDPRHRREFLAAYAPDGDWARLFRLDASYVETRLLQDADDPDRYMTIDVWQSQADRDAFRTRYAREFDEIDRRCEAYTLEETLVGDFLELGAAPTNPSRSAPAASS